MFQLPKTPHRPAVQNRLPPSPRRKRPYNKHPSRSPPRLRGSKIYRRRALRPALTSFAQDASPATDPNDFPNVSFEMTNPSSPLDRYNPTRKTAYRQLMIDYTPSPPNLLSSQTSGNHGQSKYTMPGSRSQMNSAPVSRRPKFAPPEEIDDGVFFSSDPVSNPVAIPVPTLRKKSAHTLPQLTFALDVDPLDLPSSHYPFQLDTTTDDLLTNLSHPAYSTSLARRADGPAFAYYMD